MRFIAIDTETTGLDLSKDAQVFLITACDDEGRLFHWQFDCMHDGKVIYDQKKLDNFKETINKYPKWVFHHAKYDMRGLTKAFGKVSSEFKTLADPKVKPDFEENFHKYIDDTLIQSHIVDSGGSHALKDLGILYLDILDTDEKKLKQSIRAACQWAKTHKIPLTRRDDDGGYWIPRYIAMTDPSAPREWLTDCLDYGLCDVERTVGIHLTLRPVVHELFADSSYERELSLIPLIMEIESRGLGYRWDFAQKTLVKLNGEIESLKQAIQKMAQVFGMEDFNYNSTKQLSELLFEKWDLPVLKTSEKTSNPSCDAGTLQELGKYARYQLQSTSIDIKSKVKNQRISYFIDALLHAKHLATTSRYIENYNSFAVSYAIGPSVRGKRKTVGYKIYPNLNSNGTSTVRFSSSRPNGQNISTGVEEEHDGKKVKVLSLRELFAPEPDELWVTIDYTSLQLIIFAYESGDTGMINAFLQGHDFHNYVACSLFGVSEATKDQRRIAKNVNYSLIFGAGKAKVDDTAGMPGAFDLYYHQFPIVKDFMQRIIKKVRKEGYVRTAFGYPLKVPKNEPYKGVNYIVQGDEGDIVKNAMLGCNKILKGHASQARMIFQIHDELIFSVVKSKIHLFPIQDIVAAMMGPAGKLGWVTPVDPSIVVEDWSKKSSITEFGLVI